MPAAGAVLILLSRMSLRGVDPGYDNGVRLLTLIISMTTGVNGAGLLARSSNGGSSSSS